MKNFTEFCQKMLGKRKLFSRVVFLRGKNSCLPTEIERGFWFSVKTFGRFVKTELYVSDWGLWLNCFFLNCYLFRRCFPTLGRTFCKTGAKTLEKISKVNSTWTTNLFEESLFFEKFFYFYNFFEFWWKSLRTSVGKCSAGFEKLLSTLVQGIFLHNIIILLEKICAH